MEGPSLHLAAEQLQPFVGRVIERVSGNSRIGINRLERQTIREIFAWGKHLVCQFDGFAMRTHFMLWGTFAAVVEGVSVTGDYVRSGPPRLVLELSNGVITIWSASLKFIEGVNVRETYDFSADILSPTWNPRAAFRKARAYPRAAIADVLLDQAIFAGVGNIIKNEVLFRTRTSPFLAVGKVSDAKLRTIVKDARVFSARFLELRRIFALRANLEIYQKGTCPHCGGKVYRRTHGERARRSFFCAKCQRVPRRELPQSVTSARSVSRADTPKKR